VGGVRFANAPVIFFIFSYPTDFLKCQKWAQKKQQIFFKTYCFAQCCGGITYIWFSS